MNSLFNLIIIFVEGRYEFKRFIYCINSPLRSAGMRWLPFNFETPTRKDMFEHGLTKEVEEVGFQNVSKISKFKGVFQVVCGEKPFNELRMKPRLR